MTEPRDSELDALLARVPDAEPPADLAPTIMSELRKGDPGANLSSSSVYGTTTRYPGNREWRRTTMTQQTTNGGTSRILWLAAAAVVAVAGIVYFKGQAPAEQDVAGTISPATKYAAEQVPAGTTQVEGIGADPFLQTELFDRITKDPALVEILSNDAVRNALKDDAVRNSLLSEGLKTAFQSDAIHQAMKSDAFRNVTNGLRDASTHDAVRNALKSEAMKLDAAKVGNLRDALQSDALVAVLGNDALRNALKNDGFRNSFTSDAMRTAITQGAFRDVIGSSAFQTSLKTGDALKHALKMDAVSNDAKKLN